MTFAASCFFDPLVPAKAGTPFGKLPDFRLRGNERKREFRDHE